MRIFERTGGNAPEGVTISPDGELVIPPETPEGTYTVEFTEVPLTHDGHCALCGGTVGLTHRCVRPADEASPQQEP